MKLNIVSLSFICTHTKKNASSELTSRSMVLVACGADDDDGPEGGLIRYESSSFQECNALRYPSIFGISSWIW